MHKYEVTARYYRAKENVFTSDYAYYIETDSTISPGDFIAIMDKNSTTEIRCVLIIDVNRVRKENKNILRKEFIGTVKTDFFKKLAVQQQKEKILEQLEQRSAQASKMQLYKTLAATDPEVAKLLAALEKLEAL